MQKIWFILLLCVAMYGCRQGEDTCQDNIDTSKIPLKLQVVRLEDELFACKSKKDVQLFIAKYDTLFRRYDRFTPKKPADSLQNRLWEMVQNKYMDTLYKDVKERFDSPKTGKWKQVQQDFELAFKHIKHYYPDFKPFTVYTTITGLGSFWGGRQDIEIDLRNKTIIISLEMYHGEKRRYALNPKMYPAYIAKRLTPEYIAPSCILQLSELYNKGDEKDRTLIADMIGAGKAYSFVKDMMPCLPDTLLTGYTQKDINNLKDKENREYIWNYLIEKKYIFSTSQMVNKNFMGETPYITEINQRCPGRVGWWIGYRIIQKYRKKFPDLTLRDLMNKTNTRAIFEASGYNGD